MKKDIENGRKTAMVVDVDMLVPKDHLLRKIERIMDYDWLYERLEPLYNDRVGRPGTDPVVLIKMVLLQHLYGIVGLSMMLDKEGRQFFTRGKPGKRSHRSCVGTILVSS